MGTDDLRTVLDFCDLTADELAIITQQTDAQVERWLAGTDPIPAWLDLLTLYWCEYPGAIEHARRHAVASKRDGPTMDDILAGDRAALVRDVTH